ncbi:hypothetical protein [Alkalihalobacillus deserti]
MEANEAFAVKLLTVLKDLRRS